MWGVSVGVGVGVGSVGVGLMGGVFGFDFLIKSSSKKFKKC